MPDPKPLTDEWFDAFVVENFVMDYSLDDDGARRVAAAALRWAFDQHGRHADSGADWDAIKDKADALERGEGR